MDVKLTLKLEDSIIDKAKRYSKMQHISLSYLVEKFFTTLDTPILTKSKDDSGVSPLVKEITGIFDDKYRYDLKKQKKNRLKSKYL